MSTLLTQAVTSFAELWALGPEWQALEARCAIELPFLTWEWSTSWWRHMHEDGPGIRDTLRVSVVRNDSGELVGIAPLMRTERPSAGPVRVRYLQFIGADPNITELRSMICLPGLEQECRRAISTDLAASASDWDWIVWESSQRVANDVSNERDHHSSEQDKPEYVLALPPTWPEFKKGLGRNIKQSLRKCYNTLERDGLTFSLDVLEQPEDVERGLSQFFGLHAARADLSCAVRHANVFREQQSRAFLLEVCVRLAQRRIVRLFQLRVDGRLVATRIGFVMNKALYLYYSGWDPAYAQYSVMTTLVSEALQYSIAQGVQQVHLSTGADVSKTRWGAREIRFTSFPELSPHWRAAPKYFAYQTALKAKQSKVARALTPAFLIRRSATVTAQPPLSGSS